MPSIAVHVRLDRAPFCGLYRVPIVPRLLGSFSSFNANVPTCMGTNLIATSFRSAHHTRNGQVLSVSAAAGAVGIGS